QDGRRGVIASGARCAVHPESGAVDVCKRCGKFLCGECVELVGEDAYCAECARPLKVRASRLARTALGTQLAAWGLLLLSCLAIGFVRGLVGFAIMLAVGPVSFASLIMSVIELVRIRRGSASRRGKRFAVATLL